MAKKKSAAKKRASENNATNGDASDHGQDSAGAGQANGTNGSDHAESSSTSVPDFDGINLDGGLTPSQRAEKAKAAGNEKFKAKDYHAAVAAYSEAIDLDADEAAYYNNRAAAYMALKRYKHALQDCQNAANLQSSNPQVKTLNRLARCQIALGQVDTADRTLAEVLAQEPANSQALADRARVAKIRGDLSNVGREKSKREWTYVLYGLDSLEREVDTPPLPWRIMRVEAYLGKRRVDDAASLASDLLRANTSDPDVLWVRGLVFFNQGNTGQAIAHAQQALRNDPDHSAAKTLLKRARLLDTTKEAGNDLFKRGQHGEAIDKYTECIDMLEAEEESIRVTLLSNRATAHQKLGQHDAAIKDCDEILSAQSKHFKALRTRARAHFATESYESAVADFAAAYEEAPSGTSEERAMKTEHRQAEVALKRSKTKDHYKTLCVHRTATEVEIKKAYRKQSLLHHPDKGGTEEMFKEVSEAYSVLSDPRKRQRYDLGEDDEEMQSGFGGGFHSHHHPFASSFGGSPFGGGGGINLEDFLRSQRGGF